MRSYFWKTGRLVPAFIPVTPVLYCVYSIITLVFKYHEGHQKKTKGNSLLNHNYVCNSSQPKFDSCNRPNPDSRFLWDNNWIKYFFVCVCSEVRSTYIFVLFFVLDLRVIFFSCCLHDQICRVCMFTRQHKHINDLEHTELRAYFCSPVHLSSYIGQNTVL